MKSVIRTLRNVGIIEMALGTIHCAFTPIIIRDIPGEIIRPFLFIFITTGLAYLYIGWILYKESRSIHKRPPEKMKIIVSFAFLLLTGVMAAALMAENPFAWISFLTSLAGSVILILNHKKTKFAGKEHP